MHTCARSAAHTPTRTLARTHAARTHARARCVQALDEITPLETKKAKIERDLHKDRERADKFRGACARVISLHMQSIASGLQPMPKKLARFTRQRATAFCGKSQR